jgi:hypothetical protein
VIGVVYKESSKERKIDTIEAKLANNYIVGSTTLGGRPSILGSLLQVSPMNVFFKVTIARIAESKRFSERITHIDVKLL